MFLIIVGVPSATILGLYLGLKYEQEELETGRAIYLEQQECERDLITFRTFTKRWGIPVQCDTANKTGCPGFPTVKLKSRTKYTKWNNSLGEHFTQVILWKHIEGTMLSGWIVNSTAGLILVNQTCLNGVYTKSYKGGQWEGSLNNGTNVTEIKLIYEQSTDSEPWEDVVCHNPSVVLNTTTWPTTVSINRTPLTTAITSNPVNGTAAPQPSREMDTTSASATERAGVTTQKKLTDSAVVTQPRSTQGVTAIKPQTTQTEPKLSMDNASERLCIKQKNGTKLRIRHKAKKEPSQEEIYLKYLVLYLHTGNKSSWDDRVLGGNNGIILPYTKRRTYRYPGYTSGPLDRFFMFEYGQVNNRIPMAQTQDKNPMYYTMTGWTCFTTHNRSNPGLVGPRQTPWVTLNITSLKGIYEQSLAMAQSLCGKKPEWNWGQEQNNPYHRKGVWSNALIYDKFVKPPANQTEAWARYHCISAHGQLHERYSTPFYHKWSGGHYPSPGMVGVGPRFAAANLNAPRPSAFGSVKYCPQRKLAVGSVRSPRNIDPYGILWNQ